MQTDVERQEQVQPQVQSKAQASLEPQAQAQAQTPAEAQGQGQSGTQAQPEPSTQAQAQEQPRAQAQVPVQAQPQIQENSQGQAQHQTPSPTQEQGSTQPQVQLEKSAQAPEAFFESYLHAMLQVVTGPDPEGAASEWRKYLHKDFVCLGPCGTPLPGEEAVLAEWRMAMLCGHYGSVSLSDLSLQNLGPGCDECRATLVRHYPSRRSTGQGLVRDMLRLQMIGMVNGDGDWRVTRHFYQPTPPKEVAGVQSRSQICQDLWVLHYFDRVDNGFFLEVGANHVEELSNTYLLEKAKSWKGICVEPFPQGDWTTRSAELVKVAVGPDGSRLRFVAPGHVLGGLVDQVDMPRVMRDVPQNEQGVVEVETRTLASILRLRPNGPPCVIHYLSLDTEGSEYDILLSFPFDLCTLLSVTVEHNFKEPARTQIRELLEGRGFKLDVSVEHDDFYLLEGYDKYL